MSQKFSAPGKEAFVLSPLGAAIVEAMPDRKRVRTIKRRFKNQRECPASLVFNRAQVEQFYKERGQQVQAV